jgi:Arc/MetJ-type ribon-helix-helix transcriptional regulator
MQTIRMTLRLPRQDGDMIDLFVKTGEFSSRSEFIRRAIREYSQNHAEDILKKAEAMKKLQNMVNVLEATEEYTKK